MPKVTFDTSNKLESSLSFPRLKLENGERARIVLIEPDPLFEWVHNLRAPQIVNGQPAMEKVTKRNGEVSEQMKFDFIGRPICLGDYSVIQEKGLDPENCPMCALAAKGDMVRPPERRFAMHVMRYSLKPGGFEPATPFAVQTIVWAFSDTVFNKIADFASEWGDLRQKDLLLGPCTNTVFQKYDINIAASAHWLSSPEVKQATVQTYKDNQCKDLSVFCGRRTDKSFILSDLDKIIERHALANGKTPPPGPFDSPAKSDIDDILSASSDSLVVTGELEDLFTSNDPAPVEELASIEVEEPVKETPKVKPSGTASFDDLLAGLD